VAGGGALSNRQVWSRYRDWHLDQRHSPATVRHYRVVLHDFWATLAPRPWSEVRRRDLDRWLDRRCRPHQAHAGQPLARNTRAAYSRRVLRFYTWASARRLLPGRNPFEDVAPERWAARRPRALPLDSVAALLHWLADDPRLYLMVCLGYYQMLRVGEIVRLSVEDVRLDTVTPMLRVQGKGGQETWMALNRALVPHLRAYLAGRPPNGPLIENRRRPGAHLSAGYGAELAARALRPLVGDSLHALRHTGATALRDATGWNLLVVQRALRHASAASTQGYLDDAPELLAGFLELLPDPLERQRSAP